MSNSSRAIGPVRFFAPIIAWGLLGGGSLLAQAPSPDMIPSLPDTTITAPRPAAPAPVQPNPEPANVPGRSENLLGIADSASQGTVGQADIEYRPTLRTGEILETIPGLIVTQHSGTGKANQYFLRGFNLDHGTDFSTFVDGVPVNLPTHAHGQGYTDLNFLIPELVERIDYKKGPYYADVGDFSSAGSASIHYVDWLDHSIVRFEVGKDDYFRTLLADSSQLGQGDILYAFEYDFYDGPWVVPQDYQKYDAFTKYTIGNELEGISLSGTAYKGKWTATNQIAERAVTEGLISPLGSFNPTDGGETQREGINLQMWIDEDCDSRLEANAYVNYYTLNLFNDFTYFLNDPINGDQFEQSDRRIYSGANIAQHWLGNIGGCNVKNTAGVQVRDDDIGNIALRNTADRVVLSTTVQDRVNEANVGLFYTGEIELTEKIRPMFGLRGDLFHFDVTSESTPANSGDKDAGLVSPKLGIAFGPWDKTEYYINWGEGFHSNDARGVVGTVDPTTGLPVSPATGLVRSKGGEVGVRTRIIDNLNSTLAVWYLDLDSELVFDGDSGTTQTSRPSHRDGIEWSNNYTITDVLSFDADLSYSQAHFTDFNPVGNFVPEAIESAASLGPTFHYYDGWYTTLRMKYFGPRALIEDDSVRSNSTTVVNLEQGYKSKHFQAALELLNLFDSHDHDVDFYYTSRLPGEPLAGVNDIHFHPVEPFTVRTFVQWTY